MIKGVQHRTKKREKEKLQEDAQNIHTKITAGVNHRITYVSTSR
jgi:hypothetical protein